MLQTPVSQCLLSLLSLYTFPKHLFVCMCTLSVLFGAASIWHGVSELRPIRPDRDASLFEACQFSGLCFLNHATSFIFSLFLKTIKHLSWFLSFEHFSCMPHKLLSF
jgi:hypothetical protein